MSSPVKAVKNVVKKTINVVTKVFTAVVNVAASVVSFVAEPFMGMLGGLATPDIPSGGSEMERQQGVLLQKQGSIVPIPVVYGYRKIGGTVTFAETGSTDNKYLWVAYALSEGPVEGLHEIFIDDVQLNSKYVAKLNSGQTVTLDEGKYSGRVQLQFFHGTYYDLATSSPVGSTSILADAPSWNTNMKYNGVSVMFARYEWKKIVTQEDADNNPFGGSIPELQVTMLGRKVASLTRTDPQNYDWNEGARYSTNPAEILLDYMRHPRYGKGISNDQIDWTSWATAATKCNTTVTYVTDNTQGPILTCNYVLDTSQTIFNNVKNLLMGFRAYMPYVQGKYKLKIEDAGHPTNILSSQATIELIAVADPYGKAEYIGSTCDIIGDVTYTRTDRSAKYNQVTVTYVEPTKKWASEQVVYPEQESTRLAYITEDGGYENKLEVAFPTITNYAIAKDMARLLFNKSRGQDSVSLRVTAEALELEPGDNIRIQARKLNFGDSAWRVITIKYNNDMTADIACVRNQEDFYPYTTVGQQDKVKPPYIPKGSIRYNPTTFVDTSVGLAPPKNSVIETTPVDTVVNPVPTVPSAPGDDDESAGGGNTATPVDNTPPPAPPVEEQPLDAVVDVYQITYSKEGEYWYADLRFAQPISDYAGTTFYYKRTTDETFYRTYEANQTPGQGNDVVARIGPLLNVEYTVYAKVKYPSGDFSTRVASFSAVPSGGASDPTEIISQANSVHLTVYAQAAGRRDTKCEVRGLGPQLQIVGSTYQPKSGDRYLWLTFGQSSLQPFNPDIVGVKILYRANGATYWKEDEVLFDASWFPGKNQKAVPPPGASIGLTGTYPQAYGHTLPANWEPTNAGLGVNQYPSDPGTGDNFDFIFKWIFADATASEVHTRIMNVNVESHPTFGFIYNVTEAYNQLGLYSPIYERVSEYEHILETQAPPGAVGNPADMEFGLAPWQGNNGWSIVRFNDDQTRAQIRMALYAPNASDKPYWYGCHMLYRIYGQTGTQNNPTVFGSETDSLWVNRNVKQTGDMVGDNVIIYEPDVWFPVDTKIELYVRPWTSYGTGVFVPQPSNYGLYAIGKLFPSTVGRQWSSEQLKTTGHVEYITWDNTRLTSSYSQPDPVVQFMGAKLVMPYYAYAEYNVPAGTMPWDYAYHELTWSHDNCQFADYKGIRVYARAVTGSEPSAQGPWEYWDVINSNPGGTLTSKFRIPISNQTYFKKGVTQKIPGPAPYGLYSGWSQFSKQPNIEIAVRNILQDNTLSDGVLVYRLTVPQLPVPYPKSYTLIVAPSEVTKKAFEDLNGYTDVDVGTSFPKYFSRLNIEDAIYAKSDSDFVDVSGQKYYYKRWS